MRALNVLAVLSLCIAHQAVAVPVEPVTESNVIVLGDGGAASTAGCTPEGYACGYPFQESCCAGLKCVRRHGFFSICVDVAKNSLLAQLAMNGGPVFMQATEQEVEEKPIAEALHEQIEEAGAEASETIEGVATELTEGLKEASKQATAAAKELAEKAQEIGKQVAEMVKETTEQAQEAAEELATKVKEGQETAEKISEEAATVAKETAKQAQKSAERLTEQVAGTVNATVAAVGQAVTQSRTELEKTMGEVGKQLKESASALKESLAKVEGSLWASVKKIGEVFTKDAECVQDWMPCETAEGSKPCCGQSQCKALFGVVSLCMPPQTKGHPKPQLL